MNREEIIAKAKALAAKGDVAGAKRAMALAGQKEPAPAPRGVMGAVKDNLLGDNDPTTQNFGEKVGTFLNKAGESMTFGLMGDELSGRPEHYREQEAIFDKDHSVLGVVADVGGAMALPGGVLANSLKGANILTKMGASALTAGAGSAVHAGMESEGDRIADAKKAAVVGAGVGALVPVAGAGIQKIADKIAKRGTIKAAAANAPTTEQLRAAGSAAYKQIEDAGVQIKPEAFAGARSKILQELRKRGLDELPGPGSLTPDTARAMQIAREMDATLTGTPTAALPWSSLDQLRRHAGNAAMSKKPTDAQLGSQMVSEIDDFVTRLKPSDTVTGDVKAVQDLLPKARALWSKMAKSRTIDTIMDNSEGYLGGTASGIRNGFGSILRNPNLRKGFSEAELDVMKRVANGTLPERAIVLAGGGLGNLAMTGAGGAAGGITGALLGAAIGQGARKGAEAITNKNAETARAIMANGGLKAIEPASDTARLIAEKLMRRTAIAGQGR